MFVNNLNKTVMFFGDSTASNTEKVLYGRISESIKKYENGQVVEGQYDYESWNVRFCGKARKLAEDLKDKDIITIHQADFRNPYNKEKKKTYPYILVMSFEKGVIHKEEHSTTDGEFADMTNFNDNELQFGF